LSRKLGKKAKRKLRLSTARLSLTTFREELSFEQLHLSLSDGDLHWKIGFGAQHIADYWPASGRAQIAGQTESILCSSPAQALKLAVGAKRQLFEEIASAFQPPWGELPATPRGLS